MANFTVSVPVFHQDSPNKYLSPTDKFRAITFLREENGYAIFRVVADSKLMAASRANYYINFVNRDKKIIVRRGEGKLSSWFQTDPSTGEMKETTPD